MRVTAWAGRVLPILVIFGVGGLFGVASTGCQEPALDCSEGGPGCDEGGGGQPCFANRTCIAGYACSTEGICEACVAGTRGCICEAGTTCESGLECTLGVCGVPAVNATVPANPKCFSPCRTGFVDATGEYRSCSVEGLMEGCFDDSECVQGSCVAVDASPPTCSADIDCPDHQLCIEGQCYANCDSDVDCGGMMRCYRHSCRVPCSAGDEASCADGTSCDLVDGQHGYCMPLAGPSEVTTKNAVLGTFSLDADAFRFTNVDPAATISLRNDSPRPVEFTVRKVMHREPSATTQVEVLQHPMPWLSMGEAGSAALVDSFTIRVPGNGEEGVIDLANSTTGVPERWEGELEISSELGVRSIHLEYSTTPNGRWAGKVYYFTQFGDEHLDAWVADRMSGDALGAVGNALIQKWGALRQGRMSMDEFNAVITATTTGAWRWPSVRALCESKHHAACYLYASSEGFGVYSDSLDSQPVPTGVVELPIALDLRATSPTEYSGRIATSESLHYAGNPSATITFAADPSSCASSNRSACLAFLSELDANVVVGGRYVTTSTDQECELSGEGGFELVELPWIVPGFTRGTAFDAESGNRYRYECRDTLQPFGAGADELEAMNRAFAGSNPIPDGNSRRRHIELIDGALVDQHALYVFFRERFEESFLGSSDTTGFSAYGFMLLERSNATLADEDFVGNAQAEDRTLSDMDLTSGATCDPDLLARLGEESVKDANASVIASALIGGRLPPAEEENLYNITDVHYLCHDTGRIDGGAALPCPPSSNVTYFVTEYQPSGGWPGLSCQTDGTCQEYLDGLRENPSVAIVFDPIYACVDPNETYCDDNRTDLRVGKNFFRADIATAPVFKPIEIAIDDAFRYKTQFRDRQGRNIGFAPEICEPQSNAIPYCYDPSAIEEIRQRVSCIIAIFTDFHEEIGPVRERVTAFLVKSFSYEEDDEGGTLSTPVVRDGFERLNAELLIMLGDEAYTAAFQSRFDLAGSSLVSFEGSLFEPNGIDLSGVAGYEMFTLYQATQYYGMVLDRFYALSPYIWTAVSRGGNQNFISQETVVSYFDRVLRSSTQRARAFSEIAKRYQSFNRPDLARFVVERAYTSAYLESIVLSRMMQRIVAIVTPQQRAQIVRAIDQAATTYRAALLDMREVYTSLTDELNFFGFSPDYIPLPALDPSGPNAFEILLSRAQQAAAIAGEREEAAINSNRSFETDQAAFQSELTRIRNTYENQLADICGTMEGEDGRVYPAITKYAYLNERARALGDPCGLMGTGQIHEAIAELEIQRLNILDVKTRFDSLQEQIEIEVDRVNEQCGLSLELADYHYETRGMINNLQSDIRDTRAVVGALNRRLAYVGDVARLAACSPPSLTGPGNCGTAAIAASTYAVTQTAIMTSTEISEAIISEKQDQAAALEQESILVDAEYQCDQMQADSNAHTRTLALGFLQLQVDGLRADYTVRLALSTILRLRNQAKRIEAEQSEAEQLSINVEAARNDPNVRIYRNDAIINADKAFYDAIQDAYRATRVFEYYTSQSYPGLAELLLVRLVARGDYNLQNYLADLDDAYQGFLETFGRPDLRVDILSLRDDVLGIPRYDEEGRQLSHAERIELFRQELADPRWLDGRGYLTIPFSTSLERLSPLTRNHKIAYLETEIIGSDVGDSVGRIYVTQAGTGRVRAVEGLDSFYRLPERSAVVNPFFNGVRTFTPDVYRSERLRDRPYVNTNWLAIINQRDERANQDIDLGSLTDVRVYVYYTDFTALN